MLDTVIEIGSALRQSPSSVEFFRFARKCPEDTDKQQLKRLTIPVVTRKNGLFFDLNNIVLIENEDEARTKLFYLLYRTSDSDTACKYVYGDIYYAFNQKKNKESGNYSITKKAFDLGDNIAASLKSEFVSNFRKAFFSHRDAIEMILKEHSAKGTAVFVSFNFDGKYWYEYESDFEKVVASMSAGFCEAVQTERLVLTKTLVNTLCSGNKDNDVQFPGFTAANRWKARTFTDDDIRSVFYGVSFAELPSASDPFGDLQITVLPRGRNLTAQDYIEFSNFQRRKENERRLAVKAGRSSRDEYEIDLATQINAIFGTTEEINPSDMIFFDMIFRVKEGQVLIDKVELSGLRQSFLTTIEERRNRIADLIAEQYGSRPTVMGALHNILGGVIPGRSFDERYRQHLLKVLPKIYAGGYCCDSILLPALIKTIEYVIRNSDNAVKSFYLLKRDFQFLTTLQNTQKEGANYMNIIESESYRIGTLLGRLAKEFSGKNSPIKSFEKQYAGQLSRRIRDIEGVQKMTNMIVQKLLMHKKTFQELRESHQELTETIKEFKGPFNKDAFEFGFFEIYYKPFMKNASDDQNDIAEEEINHDD